MMDRQTDMSKSIGLVKSCRLDKIKKMRSIGFSKQHFNATIMTDGRTDMSNFIELIKEKI